MNIDLAIIGAGPAGLAAGIYGARAGMDVKVFDAAMGCAQTMTTPTIENYPGLPGISGADLAQRLKDHAAMYCEVREFERVEEVERIEGGGQGEGESITPRFKLTTGKGEYLAKAVVLATGARHRHLGVPGEGRLMGSGVSYCATCDGNFFVGKDVVVIGGGNTAVTEALYLKGIGVNAELVHRRDCLRAECALSDDLEEKGVKVHYERVVRSIEGETAVEKVVLECPRDGSTEELPVNGVFVAIGVVPNVELAEPLGLELDDRGFVKADPMGRTNVEGVFAAGDVTGGLLQIITGAAQGAQAALTATEAVGKAYPF
jgi:thioredoxin reductase (NADPH)